MDFLSVYRLNYKSFVTLLMVKLNLGGDCTTSYFLKQESLSSSIRSHRQLLHRLVSLISRIQSVSIMVDVDIVSIFSCIYTLLSFDSSLFLVNRGTLHFVWCLPLAGGSPPQWYNLFPTNQIICFIQVSGYLNST